MRLEPQPRLRRLIVHPHRAGEKVRFLEHRDAHLVSEIEIITRSHHRMKSDRITADVLERFIARPDITAREIGKPRDKRRVSEQLDWFSVQRQLAPANVP